MTINIRRLSIPVVAGVLGIVAGSAGSLLLLAAISRHHDNRDADLLPSQNEIGHHVYIRHKGNDGSMAERDHQGRIEAASDADEIHRMSPEMIRKNAEDWQRRLMAIHQSHPLDPAWSAVAVPAFKKDFAAIQSKIPLKLIGVDCRAKSCLAVVGWKNYAAAKTNDSILATHDFAMNCARHIAQPPPDDVSSPYQSTIQFDCGAMTTNGK